MALEELSLALTRQIEIGSEEAIKIKVIKTKES